ncbi:MAG: DUF484 family protein [Acidithiobacillus sp.]|uniref:DUF484 family protein n=1 Tax=Acidithiobacillus sp. TaxID=1872118 RepID=UPI003D088CA6
MTELAAAAAGAPPEAAAVLAYLRAHPEFLWDQEDLLAAMTLPHVGRGSAASLLERQITLLRQQNGQLHQRIDAVLSVVRQNAELGAGLLDLAVALLQSSDCREVLEAVQRHLREHFHVEYLALVLREALPGVVEQAVVLAEGDFRCLSVLAPAARAASGIALEPGLRSDLFGGAGAGLASLALIPLRGNKAQGAIVLGSNDPDRYGPEAGVDVLDQIGRLVVAALDRCLAES